MALVKSIEQVKAWHAKKQEEEERLEQARLAFRSALYENETVAIAIEELREQFDTMLLGGATPPKATLVKITKQIDDSTARMSNVVERIRFLEDLIAA